MPLASASFQPAGEEELELLLAPGTVTGFKGVQEVKSGYYQAKLRNGRQDGERWARRLCRHELVASGRQTSWPRSCTDRRCSFAFDGM